jgi:hypothetical protein
MGVRTNLKYIYRHGGTHEFEIYLSPWGYARIWKYLKQKQSEDRNKNHIYDEHFIVVIKSMPMYATLFHKRPLSGMQILSPLWTVSLDPAS